MTSFYIRTPSGFDIEYGVGGRIVEDTWVPTWFRSPSIWGHKRTFVAKEPAIDQVMADPGSVAKPAPVPESSQSLRKTNPTTFNAFDIEARGRRYPPSRTSVRIPDNLFVHPDLRMEVEQFLYFEATLLDDRNSMTNIGCSPTVV